MAGCEGAVETGGGLGEFDWRQLEKASGGADELGGDVASAAGAAHVVEGLLDGGHVEFLGGKGLCVQFSGMPLAQRRASATACLQRGWAGQEQCEWKEPAASNHIRVS